MDLVDIPSPSTGDPFKSFAYVNFVILTYSLRYDNFDFSLFLFEKKLRRSIEQKMNADPWARPKFQLWSVSAKPPKNTPVVEYGKENKKIFTIRVVHGGFITDYPGKAYQQTKVHFISHVNIDLINMEMLGRFSRSLGYTSLGNWYHIPTEEHSGLSMIPILNDECLGPFKTLVRAQKFREIEHLYVEHRHVFVPNNFPHFLMNSPAKRVEKLVHMFVTEHPMVSVDDGIAYINHMLNMRIPREKMEDVMDMAKENFIAWKDIS